MKRLNLFLILLALASCAWAQTKARYTERLDSIVVYEYWMPSFENLTTYKNYLNTSSMGSKPISEKLKVKSEKSKLLLLMISSPDGW